MAILENTNLILGNQNLINFLTWTFMNLNSSESDPKFYSLDLLNRELGKHIGNKKDN